MATFLLILIFIAFVGLGIPDSLFGTALPVIREDLGFSSSAAGLITLLVSVGTLISSLFSARLINKFGTPLITVVSTFLTVLALLGYSLSQSMLWFCVCAIPMGIGAGAIDSALNNYAASHYTARQMSFLHCSFAVGISLSPFLMSYALNTPLGWRGGYYVMIGVQLFIALLLLFTLPVWKSVGEAQGAEESIKPNTLSFKRLIKNPAARGSFLILFSSCSIEYVVGTWTSSFLVNGKGVLPAAAAIAVALYYVGMTLGRFLSGILAKSTLPHSIIRLGFCICLGGIAIILLPLPVIFVTVGVFLIGLGNGATFPNMMYLTPINFGIENSQSVMGLQFAFSNLGIMLMPSLYGSLSQWISPLIFPYYLLALFVLMIVGEIKMTKNLSVAKTF